MMVVKVAAEKESNWAVSMVVDLDSIVVGLWEYLKVDMMVVMSGIQLADY